MYLFTLTTYWQRVFVLGVFFFCLTLPVDAESTANLEKALKSGKKEINFSGKEKSSVRIPKGVTVVGSDPSKAIISGDVVMADGATLKNVTVNGKTIAISVEKGASVRLENVTVTGASDAGVFSPKGGGTVTLINSRVRQNRKGLFLLSGKQVNIVGSAITNNQEEGLDMHAGTGGSITGSTFANNKEGGMEVIINGSNFKISGNTFSGNTASGIALQSYGGGGGGSKVGTFVVQSNTFSQNGNFGIDCKNPQGTGGAFFATSVKASSNTFGENKKGAINGICGISNAGSKANELMGEDVEEVVGEDETAEGELQEEQEATEIFESILISTEAVDFLQEDAEVLRQQSQSFVDTQKQERPFWKRAFLVDGATQEKKRVLEATRVDLQRRLNGCVLLDTYETSLNLAPGQFACSRDDREAIYKNLTEAQELLREKSILEQAWQQWSYLAGRLPRLEWKF